MKRFGVICLVLLLIGAASVSGFAAENRMTLTVGGASAPCEAGEEIRVPVTATVNTGYVSALLTVGWDAAALELTDVIYTDLAPDLLGGGVTNSGSLTLHVGDVARRDNLTGTGTFLTLVFRVSDRAAAGDYTVALTRADVLDTQIEPVAVTTVAGTVRLTDAGASEKPAKPTDPPGASDPTEATEPLAPTAAESAAATGESAAPIATAIPPTAPDRTVRSEDTAEKPDGGAALWLILAGAGIVVIAAGAVIIVRARRKS